MDQKDLIHIRWHVDREKEPPDYTLICLHPDYPDLEARVSSTEMSERVAKARLMQQLYETAKARNIPPNRLMFKINGIEE